MKIESLSAVACAAILAFGLVGCGSDEEPEEGGGTEVIDPGEFEGGGQEQDSRLAYPEAPKGYKVGSIFPNFKFRGYPDPQAGNNISNLQLVEMAEFYNPTGTEVYGPGSPFGEGNPKPKAIMLNVASSWCPPCQEEARNILPGEVAKYTPQGGLIIMQLADGPTPGEPARLNHLTNWINAFDVDYPALIDPSYKLGALFEADAYPANFIIRTRDMAIIEVIAGAPAGVQGTAFWNKFEEVLAE